MRLPGEFVGARLTLIREARGMSRRELAQLIGVTPAAVTQFEAGDIDPSPATMTNIAAALGTNSSFFNRPLNARITVDDAHFRQQRSAPAGERRRVVALGQLTLEIIDELERHLHFPTVQVQTRAVRANSYRAIEDLALELRHEWKLGDGPIDHVIWLLENMGVVVLDLGGEDERIDAFSAWSPSLRPVVFLTSSKSASRRRFDAAHELGHLVLHRYAFPGDRMLEAQANRFASAFLLPEHQFRVECPTTLDWRSLRRLKERWGVSIAALVFRAFELGIYGEATYRRGFMQLNKRGWRWDEPGEPDHERPALLSQAQRALSTRGLRMDELLARAGFSRFDIASVVHGATPIDESPSPGHPNVIDLDRMRKKR